jgi:hypothetical protein
MAPGPRQRGGQYITGIGRTATLTVACRANPETIAKRDGTSGPVISF